MKKIFSIAIKFNKKLNKIGWTDQLEGGMADKKTPKDFDQGQLEFGQDVEMEHTNDPEKAKEIAMDHLVESDDYYIGLKHLEEMLEEME